jgi:hypothetical protein
MCALSLYSCGALLLPADIIKHTASSIQRRTIPSTGEKIPVVGVGTWRIFDAGNNQHKRTALKQVLSNLVKQ